MKLKDLVIDQDAMDRFLDEMVKRNDIQVEKVETMYLKIKDMESLKSYFEELHKLEKELPLGEELDEYWTLVELASTYGKDITDNYSSDILSEINPFISQFFHYKDYIFGIMNGQGSCAWYSEWSEYYKLLGKEQLSFNF